jgi:hypothetical protein
LYVLPGWLLSLGWIAMLSFLLIFRSKGITVMQIA